MMAAVGMTGVAANLLEWIKIYLYGFLMILFPLIFIIILVNKLVASYIDNGSMASLLATPNSRGKIIRTQLPGSYHMDNITDYMYHRCRHCHMRNTFPGRS